MEHDIEPLVVALIERQATEGVSLRAFARGLGVAPSVWSRVRRGEDRPGRAFIERALRRYPDLSLVYATSLRTS